MPDGGADNRPQRWHPVRWLAAGWLYSYAYLSFVDPGGGSGHHYRLAGAGPFDFQVAAWQAYGHRGFQMPEPDARHRCRTGTGAASLGLAGAALMDAQPRLMLIHQLHETGIDPVGEARMMLDQRADVSHRIVVEVIHQGHAMGIAHG